MIFALCCWYMSTGVALSVGFHLGYGSRFDAWTVADVAGSALLWPTTPLRWIWGKVKR